MRGRLRSSPRAECSYPYQPSRGNGIFFMKIREPYITIPTSPNWTQTSRKVCHFGLVLSNFGVKLSINLETKNAKTKQRTPTHATPIARTRSCDISSIKEKSPCKSGGEFPEAPWLNWIEYRPSKSVVPGSSPGGVAMF